MEERILDFELKDGEKANQKLGFRFHKYFESDLRFERVEDQEKPQKRENRLLKIFHQTFGQVISIPASSITHFEISIFGATTFGINSSIT